jgi:hypothetical protein
MLGERGSHQRLQSDRFVFQKVILFSCLEIGWVTDGHSCCDYGDGWRRFILYKAGVASGPIISVFSVPQDIE